MPTELDKLQGTWHVAAVETDGVVMPSEALPAATITVTGGQFVTIGMGDSYAGTIEIVPRKKPPKAFDLLFTEGPPTGLRHLGIYELDGDEWRICFATRGETRPTRFETAPDTGLALQTLRRGSSVTSRPATTTAANAESRSLASLVMTRPSADNASPTEIEGEWQMIGAVFDGRAMAAEYMQWVKRITRGGVTRVMAGPQTMLEATFTLDPRASPPRIDYVNLAGQHKGKAQGGIYELTADSLRICMSPPGTARPSHFFSEKGDGRSFTTWRLLEK
ncbi:MAG TPA: TIGR03067 domain-containing protein [Gemmatimonadaceae bacterium]